VKKRQPLDIRLGESCTTRQFFRRLFLSLARLLHSFTRGAFDDCNSKRPHKINFVIAQQASREHNKNVQVDLNGREREERARDGIRKRFQVQLAKKVWAKCSTAGCLACVFVWWSLRLHKYTKLHAESRENDVISDEDDNVCVLIANVLRQVVLKLTSKSLMVSFLAEKKSFFCYCNFIYFLLFIADTKAHIRGEKKFIDVESPTFKTKLS
jgi:hypothetical protein